MLRPPAASPSMRLLSLGPRSLCAAGHSLPRRLPCRQQTQCARKSARSNALSRPPVANVLQKSSVPKAPLGEQSRRAWPQLHLASLRLRSRIRPPPFSSALASSSPHEYSVARRSLPESVRNLVMLADSSTPFELLVTTPPQCTSPRPPPPPPATPPRSQHP